MNEKFSLYLKNIGILGKTASLPIITKGDKSTNQNFIDLSFNSLMHYFNNLNKEQKKYMSFYIPTNYITISEKIKKDKIKSIFIQYKLRTKLHLLKYFFIWKLNINIFYNNNNYNNNNYNTSLYGKYIDNVKVYNLKNIDRNVDVDNRHYTKTEEEDELKKKLNFGGVHITKNKKSLSYVDYRNKTSKNKSQKAKYKFNYISKNKENKDNKEDKENKENISDNKKIYKNDIQSYNFNNSKIKKIKLNLNPKNIEYINNYLKQKKIKNNNKNKNKHLLTSLEQKEKMELEECFFRPKINKPKKSMNISLNDKNLSLNDIKKNKAINANTTNTNSRFEKLYRDNEKYKISKELKAIEYEKIASKNLTFIPETYKKIQKYKSEGNFEKRQEKFLNNKKKHTIEIKNEINSLYETICSFNPKITNDKGEYYNITNKEKITTMPVFVRLYKDGRKRQNSQMNKEIEKINNIINLSNILNPERTFNFSTINRLYENKEKQNIMNKTKIKVEKEEGITFKPFISENYYSRSINNSFYERNQKLINDRESFFEVENQKHMDNFKQKMIKKEFNKKERQKLINNIIKRLYNDSSLSSQTKTPITQNNIK